jgi:FkbM family methyltransferase
MQGGSSRERCFANMTASPSAIPSVSPPNVIHLELKFNGAPRSFALFDTQLSRIVCRDIFEGRTYPQLAFAQPVRTIVDLGANIGAATVYFAMMYPAAQVFAFEPAAKSFAMLATNTANLPQVRTFEYGLFDRDRQAELYGGFDDAAQNSIYRSHEQTLRSESIQLREAAAVLRELAIDTIDILKLDTEGCEVPILHSLATWIPRISAIYVEFHSEVDRLEIDRLLSPTHYLWRGEIKQFCRGELCYLAKACLHPDEERLRSLRPSG